MVDYNEQTNSPQDIIDADEAFQLKKKQEFVHANASSTTATTTKKGTTSLRQCISLPQHNGKGRGFLREKRKEKPKDRIPRLVMLAGNMKVHVMWILSSCFHCFQSGALL